MSTSVSGDSSVRPVLPELAPAPTAKKAGPVPTEGPNVSQMVADIETRVRSGTPSAPVPARPIQAASDEARAESPLADKAPKLASAARKSVDSPPPPTPKPVPRNASKAHQTLGADPSAMPAKAGKFFGEAPLTRSRRAGALTSRPGSLGAPSRTSSSSAASAPASRTDKLINMEKNLKSDSTKLLGDKFGKKFGDEYTKMVETPLKEYNASLRSGVGSIEANLKLQKGIAKFKAYADAKIQSGQPLGEKDATRFVAMRHLDADLKSEIEQLIKPMSKQETSALFQTFNAMGKGAERFEALNKTEGGRAFLQGLSEWRHCDDSLHFVVLADVYGEMSPENPGDPHRPLTAEGEVRFKTAVDGLKHALTNKIAFDKNYPPLFGAPDMTPVCQAHLARLEALSSNPKLTAQEKAEELRNIIQQVFLDGEDDSVFPINLSQPQKTDILSKKDSDPSVFSAGLKNWRNDALTTNIVTDVLDKPEAETFFDKAPEATQKSVLLALAASAARLPSK